MTKQPLHDIDALFQQKLEEMPVDVSQQGAQWQALSRAMHQQPKGWWTQLQKPWMKWMYMTLVAWVPFAVFYFTYQPPVAESPASRYTPARVTESLPVLTITKKSTQTNPVTLAMQAAIAPDSQQKVRPVVAIPTPVKKHQAAIHLPGRQQDDTVQVAPVKKELPVKVEKPAVKKADSSYIYWQ